MSTGYRLHCYTHDVAGEFGGKQPALDTLVDLLASRDELRALFEAPIWASMDSIPFSAFYGADILHWFALHNECDVGIRDEYGYRYDFLGNRLEKRDD